MNFLFRRLIIHTEVVGSKVIQDQLVQSEQTIVPVLRGLFDL